MTILRFIIYVFLMIASPSWAQDEKSAAFEIDDLLSLYNSGEVDEFLARAKDIRPAVRGPRWRAMVTEFTKKKLDKLLETPLMTISFEEVQKVEEYTSIAHNLNDVSLQNKKLEFGLKYLTHSLKEISSWEMPKVVELKKWWYKHWLNSTQQAIHAYRYAQLFDQYSPLSKFESVNLVAFFENQERLDAIINEMLRITYKSGLAGDLCQDPWVWNYLWVDLKSFVGKVKKSDLAEFDTKIVREYSLNCWNAAKSRVLNNFHRFSEQDIHFSLHLLSMDRTLSSQQRTFIHIFYLLFEPAASELYIKALDTLLKLSLSEANRLEVLDKFLKLDPLEGKVFASSKPEALEVLIRMSRSFPEYLDQYAQTCLDYIAGTKKFPAGNPTPHCLDFCRNFRKQDLVFFNKPVYKSIIEKYRGQCEKLPSSTI